MLTVAHAQPARAATQLHALRREAGIQLVGQLARAAQPALSALTVQLFGAQYLAAFMASQAALYVARRLALGGLERGLLYWLPKARSDSLLGTAFVRVAAASVLLVVVGCVGLVPLAAEHSGLSAHLYSLLCVALVPMALSDLLRLAHMARRRTALLRVVHDVTGPLVFCLLLFSLRIGDRGTHLGAAFLGAQLVTMLAMWVWVRPPLRWQPRRWLYLPDDFERYARAAWGTELVAALTQRADMFIVASLAGPSALTAYGVASQVGNAIRALRSAFEPLLTTLTSQARARGDITRMRLNVTYVTTLVTGAQLFLSALVLLFARHWFDGLATAVSGAGAAAAILCVAWTFHSGLGLSGSLVQGLGRSDVALKAAVGTLAMLLLLGAVLVPPFGAVGAATAVAVAFGLQAIVMHARARQLLGAAPCAAAAWRVPAWIGAAAVVAAALQHFVAASPWAAPAALAILTVTGACALAPWLRAPERALTLTHLPMTDSLVGHAGAAPEVARRRDRARLPKWRAAKKARAARVGWRRLA